MNMVPDVPGRGRTIAIWVLRIFLGLIFLEVGATKLIGTTNTVEYFSAIGWGQWFRYFTGFLDIAGVVLLFIPRLACYGAAVLACSAGLATFIAFTVLRRDPVWGGAVMVLVPLVLASLAAVIALLTRPRKMR